MGLTNAQRLQIQRTQVNNSTNSSQLNGIPASGYPLLNGDNVFTGDNTFNGNQIFSGSISITGSIFSAVTGSLFGTSSWAQYAISSSYALSASRAVSSSYALNSLSGSYALTASYAMNGGGGGGSAFPFSGSAVITGSLIVSSSGISILNTSQGTLNDASNQSSVFWTDRTLRVSNTETSVDWLYRQLHTSTSLDISLDWQDRYLRSEGGAISVDWANRYLVDSTNANRIDWGNGYLLDNGTLTSIDWQNRYLVDTNSANKIDWQNAYLNDTSNVNSVSWEARTLNNTLGQDSIQWNNYKLYDPAQGAESLDWFTRTTKATDNYNSIDWENRTLTDSLGNTALNWYSASGSPGIRLYGTASYALTASSADAFTVRGNLIVSGSTTIGDATTDTITMTAATMSLGSGTGILNIDSNTFVVDGANNRVGVGKINPNSALDVNGNTTLSGSFTFAAPTSPAFNGEIVQFGAGTLTTGQLYFLSSSGTWSLANANSTGSSTGMLGIAVGSSPTTNGLLIRGFAASSSYTYGTGSVVYMATGSGIMTATSPSSSNHVVRVMGYQTTLANTIYFDPDKTWVTLA